jgi:hypothetical protein
MRQNGNSFKKLDKKFGSLAQRSRKNRKGLNLTFDQIPIRKFHSGNKKAENSISQYRKLHNSTTKHRPENLENSEVVLSGNKNSYF